MTIIVVKAGMMAADSASFQNDIMFLAPEKKIVQAPDGGLIGAAGATGDCQILRRWVTGGMDFAKPPKFSFADAANSDSVLWLWLWLKSDLTVYMGDCCLNIWRVPSPVAIGVGAGYVYGLLDAGTELPEAIRRVIARVPYLGGKVQIETIGSQDDSGAIIEVIHGETFDQALVRARGQ